MQARFVPALFRPDRHLLVTLLPREMLSKRETLQPLLDHQTPHRRPASHVAPHAALSAQDGSVPLLCRLEVLEREVVRVVGVDGIEEGGVVVEDGLGDGVQVGDTQALVGRGEGEDLGEEVAEGDGESRKLLRGVDVEGRDSTVTGRRADDDAIIIVVIIIIRILLVV